MSRYIIVTGDFNPWGGMDRANYELARFLAERGDTVHLIAHRVDLLLAKHPQIVVHPIGRPWGSHLLGAPLLDAAGRRCKRQLSDWRRANLQASMIVNGGNCQGTDINWVHYVHAAWHSQAANVGSIRRLKGAFSDRYFAAAERDVIPQARIVLANSERTRRDLMDRLKIHEDRIHVVYYGTDSNSLQPATARERHETRGQMEWPADRPLVAFVGALGDERKGFDTAYVAWKTLCEARTWDADLIVIGSGRSVPQWQTLARQDGLASRILFLGFRRDVPRLLGACDALIAPARYEAYGLGVHEAVCCGLPAIVSRCAGVAERYPSDLDDLLLDDPNDTDELIARLLHWRKDRKSVV